MRLLCVFARVYLCCENWAKNAKNPSGRGLSGEARLGENAGTGTEVEYAYDELGRFASVTSGDEVFTYGYVPGSSLVGSVANNHGLVRTTTYEPHRNLIATVENAHSNNVISRFDYANDAIGRRIAITRTGSAFSSLSGSIDHYGYNDLSELVSAHRTLDGEEVRGFSFGYAYDPIGNRTSSTEWDESGIPRTSHYTANELNEYESRTIPGHVIVLGEAATDSIVTVNGNPTWRKGAYFAGGDDFDNASSNVYAELTTTAVRSSDEDDEVESSNGYKFLATTPEIFTYDDDGNMTSDGRFTYTWDAENRLIAAETRDDLTPDVPRIRVENSYDHKFRRIGKYVWTNSVAQYHSKFSYEKWNMAKELRFNNDGLATSCFVWGLDLSGTLHKAGGVGGLLLCSVNGKTLCSAFDGNGNVSSHTSHSGQVICRYAYSPGGMPLAFDQQFSTPFLFSSKYYDPEVRTYYYGYRYHNPAIGRWLSRDLIDENDSRNLLSFVRNDSISKVDGLGLKVWLEISPLALGTIHCSLLIETCDEKGFHRVTYEIGPFPNIGPHPGETRGITWRTKLFVGSASGSASGSSSSGSSGSGCSACASSAGSSSGSAGLSVVFPGPTETDGEKNKNRRIHLYVVDSSYDNDQKYIDTAKLEPLGVYDLFSNNCCDWARRVINGAGGSWPLGHSLNYGFTEANPDKSEDEEIDEIDLNQPHPDIPASPGSK